MNKENMSNGKNICNIIKKGKVFSGTVKSIKPYGVFVKISPNATGVLHIEDISNAKIKNPEEVYKVGNKIKVMIKNYNCDTGKISLSTKNLLNSWDDEINFFSENMSVKGIVRNKCKNGFFVELKPNVIGLAEYKGYVSYGDEVEVLIKKISRETKKIKLAIVD